MSFRTYFTHFANGSAKAAGSPWATVIAIWLILAWAISGPVYHFDETWQLIINTGTTIVTFLMVFIIQHSQNCDSATLHIKLDEIIRALHKADDSLMDLTQLDEQQLSALRKSYDELAATAKAKSGDSSPGVRHPNAA